ncbi:MAG: tetratricopeptide repeat protein [Deltaproteobacteria bacterium]|nr:tetratricopeptide repeat protein [Deltaproteobacteria bacterium]
MTNFAAHAAQSETSGAVPDYRQTIKDLLLLLAAVIIVYGRSTGHDFLFNWDDNLYIINNETVRGFSWDHLKSAFMFSSIGQYNPLSLISFMFDYTLWGMWPGGYHLTNIAIHFLNGAMVYYILSRLHGDRLVSLLAALLFLLHPVQVESVAWVSERKGLLAAFFFLLSLEGYRRYHDAEKGSGRKAYYSALACFVLSLCAKSSTVFLPVLLLVYDHFFLARHRRPPWWDKTPFALAAVIFAAIEMFSASSDQGGSRGGYHGGSPLATFYTMLPVFCRYLKLLIWPSGLNVEHWPPVYTTVTPVVLVSGLLLAFVGYIGWRICRPGRRIGFWVIFVVLCLLPVSQIVPLFLLMYEHYLYLPMIAVGALSGLGAAWVRDRLALHGKRLVYVSLSVCIAVMMLLSYQRTGVWRDSLTLFKDASLKSPAAFRVWDVLGQGYKRAGNIQEARRCFERSLKLLPTNHDTLWMMGEMLTGSDELDEGRVFLNRLLEIKPGYVKAWATLGDNYLKRGDYENAEKMYRRALALQPEAMQVVQMLGNLAVLRGKYAEARSNYEQVDALWKNNSDNAYQLACVEALSGRPGNAISWLETAMQRGFSDCGRMRSDLELSNLWRNPGFADVLGRCEEHLLKTTGNAIK